MSPATPMTLVAHADAYAHEDRNLALEGPALRCASLLKPLYAWAAHTDSSPTWAGDMRAAVTTSDNAATDRLVASAGGLPAMLDNVAALTGQRWRPAATWGRVPVRATEVAAAYRALQVATDPAGAAIRTAMLQVRSAQQLGGPAVWSTETGTPADQVAVKAGWDLSDDEPFLRTHLVLQPPGRTVVVLTATPLTAAHRATWTAALATGGPEGVLPLHESWAGQQLHAALRQAARSGRG